MAISRRVSGLLAVAASSALVLSGCSSSTEPTTTDSSSAAAVACETPTEVTMLGTIKIEIHDAFLNAVDVYNSTNSDCVEIKVIETSTGANSTFFGDVTPMYEAGEAPVIMYTNMEVPDMAARVMDWTGTELASLAAPGTLDFATIDGRIVGIPSTAEGIGLLYNKAVLDEAGVDPSTLTTRSALEAAFKAVEATGRDAIHFSGLWWSLGAHFGNVYKSTVSADRAERHALLDSLAAGTADLNADPHFQDFLDTFDMFKAYSTSDATISDEDYNPGLYNLADGNVGFWFMGNWAETNLLEESPDNSFGILPVPTSDNAADYGNDSIAVGVPGYFMIDNEQSTQEERDGAVAFLSWFLTTPEGQQFWAGTTADGGFNFIPVYSGFTVQASTFMSQSISEYVNAGKTLEWVFSNYPAGLQNIYGAAFQKYYDGKTDRAGLAAELEAAWTQVE